MVRQGEGCFAAVKPKPNQEDLSGSLRQKKNSIKDNSWVCLDEEAFAEAKDVGLEQQTSHF